MTSKRLPVWLPLAAALLLAGCSSMPESTHQTEGQAPQVGRASPGNLLPELPPISASSNLCTEQELVHHYAEQFLRRHPLPLPSPDLSLEQARCGQKTFLKSLIPSAGPVVGYKREVLPISAHASAAEADRLPIRGNLLEKMILPNNPVVATQFGAVPRIEADLVAVVRSAALHDAQSPREVLASLSAIHPFIELSDLAYQKAEELDVTSATLVNVNGRFGVLGPAIDIEVTEDMVNQLANMRVKLMDKDGQVLQSALGSSLAGNPLNAVIWLVNELQKSGIRVHPGDLLSLGAFGQRITPKAGQQYRVVYEGLPDTPEVSVQFR
ncbi:MAG: hypothetical protein Q4D91_04085 [Lautropia sp.]|nr:hypothetical protein [Lautropia sp.]